MYVYAITNEKRGCEFEPEHGKVYERVFREGEGEMVQLWHNLKTLRKRINIEN